MFKGVFCLCFTCPAPSPHTSSHQQPDIQFSYWKFYHYYGTGNDCDDDIDDYDVDNYDVDNYDVDHYDVDHHEVDNYEVGNFDVDDYVEGNDIDVDDYGEDGDIDLVVSVLILNMLCNESHWVDRFLKMWLLTQLTLSKTTAIISF